jgi:hypothetical protein
LSWGGSPAFDPAPRGIFKSGPARSFPSFFSPKAARCSRFAANAAAARGLSSKSFPVTALDGSDPDFLSGRKMTARKVVNDEVFLLFFSRPRDQGPI